VRFCGRQFLDGGGHDAAWIVAALAGFPAVDLLKRIGDRLAGHDRLAFTRALSIGAMTG
jgi:hypothetical protein